MALNIIAFLLVWLIVYGLIAMWRQSPKQIKFIQNYTFHPGIKVQLVKRHPGLTEVQIEQVFQGLRSYFEICRKANGIMIAMPSRIVDEAWHEFILYTREYNKFCQRAFNHFLHHNPSDVMSSTKPVQFSIKLAWKLSCEQAVIDHKKATSLPLLFAIDTLLEIPDGFNYSFDCSSNNSSYCVSEFACGGNGGCGGGGGCGGCGGC